jgi:hypothetical protein
MILFEHAGLQGRTLYFYPDQCRDFLAVADFLAVVVGSCTRQFL